jgi:hypothetical protein
MSFLSPLEGGSEGPEKAGPGSAGYGFILLAEGPFQQGERR